MESEKLYRVRELLYKGQIELAKAFAKQRETQPVEDSAFHLKWAEVLENLNLFDDVIFELNLAIRDDPKNPETYKKLSELYLDQGNVDKAARCFYSLIKQEPLNPKHYKTLGHILENSSYFEKAAKVYQVAYERTKDESFNKLIRALDFLNAKDSKKETVQKEDLIIPNQSQLVTFTALFSGREGVYARQWSSPTGETGYTPIHEPFTLKASENHILGNMTAGIYPVRIDNTVNFIAFDLDLPKFLISKLITSERLWKSAMEKLNQVSLKIVDIASSFEIPIYIEDSGFKGRHCWIFLDMPVQAGVAKKAGEMIISQLKYSSSEVMIEIFPKQGFVKQGSLGNLIKIPLGFHKKTGKRSLFVQPSNEPYPNQLNFLETIVKASKKSIYSLIQKFNAPVYQKPDKENLPWGTHEEKPSIRSNDSFNRTNISAVPQTLYEPENDQQLQYLLMKCSVISNIVEKVEREAMINKEETLVIIHSVGHLDNGPDAVNYFLRRCVNADPSNFMKSKLKGNPVSCPKIRARVPDITSKIDCNCKFDTMVNMYPTPLIHIQNMSAQKQPLSFGLGVESIRFQNVLQDYLKLRKQILEINISLSKHEKSLNEVFDQAGLDLIQTPMGQLKRIKKEDGTFSFSLEI
ncbi:MAG: hypothetical protein HQK79_21360 [Desulfobacterales bacterium]|nr:hypothetical protein [Desulfobacterales bacterium]